LNLQQFLSSNFLEKKLHQKIMLKKFTPFELNEMFTI
jgi:hypothetical protein